MRYLTPILLLLVLSCNNKKAINNTWIGEWKRNEWMNDSKLNILSIQDDSLTFHVFASNGANMGELEGKAYIKDSIAIYRFKDENDECIIEFTIRGDSMIIVNQKKGMCDCGMGVDYAGNYLKSNLVKAKNPDLLKLGVF